MTYANFEEQERADAEREADQEGERLRLARQPGRHDRLAGLEAETLRRAAMTQDARDVEDAQADSLWRLQHSRRWQDLGLPGGGS
ncbi:MAG: hypothetical protein V3S82_10215 [Dehalococcoidia bacterium]